jgi:predicted nucleotidyltransferase
MEPSFEKLLVKLTDSEVLFVVVGGIAVALNGYVRLTEDVDILVESSEDNIKRLLGCLSEFGEGFASELSVEDFSDDEAGAIRVVEATEDCQIDIFTTMSGMRFQNLMQSAEETEVKERRIRYASKQDLIQLKSGSVREKDQIDVIALTRLLAEEQPP